MRKCYKNIPIHDKTPRKRAVTMSVRPEGTHMTQRHLTRRAALAATATMALSPGLRKLLAADARRFRIGACDWSIGKRQQIEAFDVAQQIGLDGVQVSFDDVGARYDLRQPEVRDEFAAASKKIGVDICSLAMGVLNNRPYATDDDAEQWVSQCVDVMAAMGQKIVLLAFFGKGDILDRPDLQAKVVERLKKVAPKAEQAGVVLGLETWLDADTHLKMLDAVASPAVQVYYDLGNMNKRGYDVYHELRQLGRDRICQIHTKEYGHLLGEGRVDYTKVKAALDEIGWTGWLVVEGATVPGKSMIECYQHNHRHLRSVFPTGS
jgi:sugar phosphate isomerase/epimerase